MELARALTFARRLARARSRTLSPLAATALPLLILFFAVGFGAAFGFDGSTSFSAIKCGRALAFGSSRSPMRLRMCFCCRDTHTAMLTMPVGGSNSEPPDASSGCPGDASGSSSQS